MSDIGEKYCGAARALFELARRNHAEYHEKWAAMMREKRIAKAFHDFGKGRSSPLRKKMKPMNKKRK